MLDPLPIKPFTRPVCGEVTLPGSKSITNRALLLAALGDGPVAITNALFSDDTDIMITALRRLGFEIAVNAPARTMRVAGQAGKIPAAAADLLVGNAGTAARFLTALCAAAPRGSYRLDGVPQMRTRPMQGLIEALRGLGAEIRCPGAEGFFPLEIRARGLRGGPVGIDASESSQMLSALLLVAPLAEAPVEITLGGAVRRPFVEMTARMMAQFGQPTVAREDGRSFLVPGARPYRLAAANYEVEADATAASYFLALPLVTGGRIAVPALRHRGEGMQGDARFFAVLEEAGLTVADLPGPSGLEAFRAAPAPRPAVTRNFCEFSDTFLTLAAIAPLLAGPTRISGIAHTRRQETDRVAGAARELRRLGQEVVEEADALTITPRPLTPDATVETYHDHRFAMSFAILGCHDLLGNGRPWLRLRDPGCCAKTFPDFFAVLDQLHPAMPSRL